MSERDGYVYINSHHLDEPYLKPGRRDHEPPRTWPRIPAGHYYIVGKVAVLNWPPSRFGFR